MKLPRDLTGNEVAKLLTRHYPLLQLDFEQDHVVFSFFLLWPLILSILCIHVSNSIKIKIKILSNSATLSLCAFCGFSQFPIPNS